MMWGLSLVRNRALIHASELGYHECESLQVICPACFEPVHKRGSALTRREYLAHYKATGTPDCELRVMRIVQSQLDGPIYVAPKGQELERFLKQFAAIVIESNPMFREENLKALIERALKRPEYRRILRAVRDHMPRHLKRVIADLRTEDTGFSSEMFDTVETVIQYLCSPNSFLAYSHAATLGLITILVAANAADEVGATGKRFQKGRASFILNGGGTLDDLRAVADMACPLIEYSDRELVGLWKETSSVKQRQEFANLLGRACAQAVLDSAMRFVVAIADTNPRKE